MKDADGRLVRRRLDSKRNQATPSLVIGKQSRSYELYEAVDHIWQSVKRNIVLRFDILILRSELQGC